MTTASTKSYYMNFGPDSTGYKLAVHLVAKYGPTTMHDASDRYAAEKGESGEARVGQTYQEVQAWFSTAAKKGFLDDTEEVEYVNPDTGVHSVRTLFKLRPVKIAERPTKNEALMAEVKALRSEVEELKHKIACRDVLLGKISDLGLATVAELVAGR